MDIELTEDVQIDSLKTDLIESIPLALKIYDMKEMQGKVNSLMSVINRAKYVIDVKLIEEITQEKLQEVFKEFLSREEVIVMRFKKNSRDKRPVNIRTGVYHMDGQAEGSNIKLYLTVQTGSEGNIRPEEVVYGLMDSGLPIAQDIVRIHREGLYIISEDDQLISPINL